MLYICNEKSEYNTFGFRFEVDVGLMVLYNDSMKGHIMIEPNNKGLYISVTIGSFYDGYFMIILRRIGLFQGGGLNIGCSPHRL